MGYDKDIIGVGNPNHTANEEDVLEPEFTSNNLGKAFQYHTHNQDEEILISVFDFHDMTIQNSINNLTELVLMLRDSENHYAANIICREIEQLKTLLK